MGRYLVAIVLIAFLACARKGAKRVAPTTTPGLSTEMDSIVSIVSVKICVNWKGEVVSTEFQPSKSTVSDTTLIHKSIQAARNYKFEEKQGSPNQCGDITFKFKQKKQ